MRDIDPYGSTFPVAGYVGIAIGIVIILIIILICFKLARSNQQKTLNLALPPAQIPENDILDPPPAYDNTSIPMQTMGVVNATEGSDPPRPADKDGGFIEPTNEANVWSASV